MIKKKVKQLFNTSKIDHLTHVNLKLCTKCPSKSDYIK